MLNGYRYKIIALYVSLKHVFVTPHLCNQHTNRSMKDVSYYRVVNRAGLFGSGSGLTLTKISGYLELDTILQINFQKTKLFGYLMLTLCRLTQCCTAVDRKVEFVKVKLNEILYYIEQKFVNNCSVFFGLIYNFKLFAGSGLI